VYTHFNILPEEGYSFTLNIPFFCQACGNCCRNTSYPDPKNLHLLELLPGLKSKLNAGLIIKEPCLFLEGNKCQIYSHRPRYCREWFPRMEANCAAFDLHRKMCGSLLKDWNYQIGIREVIYLKEYFPSSDQSPYPQVNGLGNITKEALRDYHSSSDENFSLFWEIFLSFKPNSLEKEIFLTLNPSLRYFIRDEFDSELLLTSD
jgi:Fe-S-cluster containining protein